MQFIKNYDALANSPERKLILDLIEVAITAIQPENALSKNFLLQGKNLVIQNNSINIDDFERFFLIGFGKGSANVASIIEKKLGILLTKGYVIDVTAENFSKIDFTLGTHPLPSQENLDFTQNLLDKFTDVTEKDLVIVVTCGGGSALLEKPLSLSLKELKEVNKQLLRSGANIHEMNIVRKHLSRVKGGRLATTLYPATIYNLIFSDVPGNDISTIASGPLVLDESTMDDAVGVIKKYNLDKNNVISRDMFAETPKDKKYFEKIKHAMILSNKTALEAMADKAKDLGKNVKILSDSFQSEARIAGKTLIENCQDNMILLAAGETTVKVIGTGQGGRNQEVVLGALEYLKNNITIASFASDGWDNIEVAGAIGDAKTLEKARSAGLLPNEYLDNNDSLPFFKAVGDAILTDRLPTNISDIMIVSKSQV